MQIYHKAQRKAVNTTKAINSLIFFTKLSGSLKWDASEEISLQSVAKSFFRFFDLKEDYD